MAFPQFIREPIWLQTKPWAAPAETAPLIQLPKTPDARKPYPMPDKEQRLLVLNPVAKSFIDSVPGGRTICREDITTHYSSSELGNLIMAAETDYGRNPRKKPAPVILQQA